MGIVNRWYDILKMLLAHDQLTAEEFQKNFSLTPHTLKNSIKLLNEEMIGIAHIHQDKHVYTLEIFDFQELDKIMSGSFKRESDFNSSTKRIAYLLKTLILNPGYHVITDIAEDLSVSRNTVNSDLKTARQLIKEYDVEIESLTSKGIRLTGDVFNKRMVYSNHVQDYFHYEFLEISSLEKLDDIQDHYQISKDTMTMLTKAIDVIVGSIKAKDLLDKPIDFFSNHMANTEAFNQLILFVETEFNLTLSHYEQEFLSYPLNLNNINRLNHQLESGEASYLPEIFNNMVDRIRQAFMLDIDRDFLYSEMSIHLLYLINRSIFHVKPNEMFFGELEKKYPFSYAVAKVATQSISLDINRQISLTEIDYLTLYFEMMLRRTKQDLRLNVAIISNTGHGTASIIRRQIERIVGDGTHFTQYSEDNYQQADLSQFFVIFTTIPLQEEPDAVPIIRIANIFSDQWLSDQLQKVKATNTKLIDSMLFDLYHLDTEKDYLWNLTFMIDALQQEGIVDKQFKERIIQREHKRATTFDNGIAFPHAINRKNRNITLTIGVCSRDYVVENEKVNLIILLAVPDYLTSENETKLFELYDIIFRMANESNFKEDIYEMFDKSDFIEYIEKRRLSL